LLTPLLMSLKKQRFDFLPVLAGAQFGISHAPGKVRGRIEIGVHAVVAHDAAKRLLVGPVRAICIVAHAALLRGVGAVYSRCTYPSFGGIPGKLLGDVRQIGGV
jgi:hypothetical protein